MKLNDSENLLMDIIKNKLFGVSINIKAIYKNNVDWKEIFREAARHNVLPLLLQNIDDLSLHFDIPGNIINKWRITVYNQIAFNEKLMFYQNEVISVLDKAQIPYAVLKGASLCAYYPRPDLRVLNDIDLLLRPSDFKQAVEILCEYGFEKRKMSAHFHEVLDKDDIVVEPHYTVTYINKNKTGNKIREFFEDALSQTAREKIGQYTFNVLSVERQAMALLLHMERHIGENKLDLRRLCDWALFISQKANNEVWINIIQPELVKCGLLKFAMLVTKICIIYLGLNAEHCLWAEAADTKLCEKLFLLILRNYNVSSKQPSIVMFNTLRAKREYPILNDIPLLIPFVCVFIQLRFLYEMNTGKRLKISVLKTIYEAIQLNCIFNKLKLYKAK